MFHTVDNQKNAAGTTALAGWQPRPFNTGNIYDDKLIIRRYRQS